MIIELRLGAFCAPLSEQLPPGLVADEPLTHLQRDADTGRVPPTSTATCP